MNMSSVKKLITNLTYLQPLNKSNFDITKIITQNIFHLTVIKHHHFLIILKQWQLLVQKM